MRSRLIAGPALIGTVIAVVWALGPASGGATTTRHGTTSSAHGARAGNDLAGIHKIRHVVIIMQENRSFDSYFGTYPKADGIPGLAGHPGKLPCVPNYPDTSRCLRPFHDRELVNIGGPHDNSVFAADLDAGKMDGFIKTRETCTNALDPFSCQRGAVDDVMGYHTAVGSSRVDLQACKLEYSIVSPK